VNTIKLEDINLKKGIIVDVRTNDRFVMGHMLNAINIPYLVLKSNPESFLKENIIYYLYCEYGEQSKKLADRLNELGFEVYSIEGGYDNYLKTL